MANAPKNERKIYDAIERKRIRVHPLIWGLLNHHIRNDLQVVVLGAEELRLSLKEGNCSLSDLLRVCEVILERGKTIDEFLFRLKSATTDKEQEKCMTELFENV